MLDAVIAVLALVVLLERALPRRTISVRKRELAFPPAHLADGLGLWAYCAGSVAGNVAHAPATDEIQPSKEG